MTDPAVIAIGLAKHYPNGATGLEHVSVTIPRSVIVALTGPSGSGKTTFLRLCNGSLRPSSGDLRVLGRSVRTMRGRDLRQLRRSLAVIPQSHHIVPSLSVLQNVLLGTLGRTALAAAMRRIFAPTREERRAVAHLLARLGIEDKIETRGEDLSGGQQQRVAVARALIQRPTLLLADEPVASVDQDTADRIMDVLRSERDARGTTVLVSLHQSRHVSRCDGLVRLSKGHVANVEGAAAALAPS